MRHDQTVLWLGHIQKTGGAGIFRGGVIKGFIHFIGQDPCARLAATLQDGQLFVPAQGPSGRVVGRVQDQQARLWPDGGEQVVLEDPHDVWILLFHAMSAVDMGKVVEARREIDIVIEAAQRIGALETLCVAWGFSPVVAQIAGDRADIELARARRALQLAEGLESPLSSYFARWGLGIAQLSAENWEEAERLLRSSLAGARESGVGLQGEAGMMSNLAEAIAGQGDLEGAVALAREAISVGRRRGTSLFECLALLTFARFQLMAGDAAVVAEVEGCIERADEIIEADGLASMKPLVHVLRAFLAAGAGAADRAEKELRVAQALFLRMGAPGNAERVAALLPGLVAP